MELIDTHTHLFSEKFSEDRTEVVNKAIGEGVKKMFLPNINVSTIQPMMELVSEYPENCFPLLGLHPCDVTESFEEDLARMKPLFEAHRFYGVGETGIDMHWDKTTLEIQKRSLKIQIDWAKEFQLPIIIHARESYSELFDVFDEENDDSLTGVFHCFTGDQDQAKKIIDYGGFKLGLGGVLTFKNSGLAETIKDIDIEHLVLETDSPYLAPQPNRGKRNESSFIYYIASKLAEVKNISFEEVASVTTKNASNLFNI